MDKTSKPTKTTQPNTQAKIIRGTKKDAGLMYPCKPMYDAGA